MTFTVQQMKNNANKRSNLASVKLIKKSILITGINQIPSIMMIMTRRLDGHVKYHKKRSSKESNWNNDRKKNLKFLNPQESSLLYRSCEGTAHTATNQRTTGGFAGIDLHEER